MVVNKSNFMFVDSFLKYLLHKHSSYEQCNALHMCSMSVSAHTHDYNHERRDMRKHSAVPASFGRITFVSVACAPRHDAVFAVRTHAYEFVKCCCETQSRRPGDTTIAAPGCDTSKRLHTMPYCNAIDLDCVCQALDARRG